MKNINLSHLESINPDLLYKNINKIRNLFLNHIKNEQSSDETQLPELAYNLHKILNEISEESETLKQQNFIAEPTTGHKVEFKNDMLQFQRLLLSANQMFLADQNFMDQIDPIEHKIFLYDYFLDIYEMLIQLYPELEVEINN